jgi:two-component system, sensor histidine kinase and response regulator
METGDNLEYSIKRSDYKILIVDDVMSNVLLLRILLTKEQFQVCTASNGHQCIEQAKIEKPDLILLDVMMPDISGFETATILKRDPKTKDIPIIFLTALNSPADLVKGFQVGASDFLPKPFNKEELVIRVMHQISLVAAKRLIEKQNEELKRTIEGRDKMYSVIAHDLRSPMGSVKMVLNMLSMMVSPDTLGPELSSLLIQANQQTEEVFSLLDNLLKWTKTQTGRLNVVFQDFNTDEVILGVIEIFNMVAEMKHIKIKHLETSENLKIHADIDMIKTIIRNFMSNAIKFSEKDSSIEIYVAREGDFAKISVQDHGRGISDENQNKLFKVESNYTTYGTANEEGSGLGLLLCKDFAIKNGGDLLLESKEGEGSIFSLLVPIYKE